MSSVASATSRLSARLAAPSIRFFLMSLAALLAALDGLMRLADGH